MSRQRITGTTAIGVDLMLGLSGRDQCPPCGACPWLHPSSPGLQSAWGFLVNFQRKLGRALAATLLIAAGRERRPAPVEDDHSHGGVGIARVISWERSSGMRWSRPTSPEGL